MPKGKYFERIIDRLPLHDKDNAQAYVPGPGFQVRHSTTHEKDNVQNFVLRQIREKGFFQTVFNTIQEGIIVVDKELKIRYANKTALEMLGIPENIEEQRISRFLKDVNWKDIMAKDEKEWYKISRKEIEILYPVRRNLLFYVVPHEIDKDTAIIILHDVTESRMNTLKTLESEKNQLISLLAAGVAHEIGNPINSIHIHLQLLERKLGKRRKKDEEALELLAVAEREVKRLDMIISQFLQAVRPTAPKMSAGVELKQIIIETLNFMQYEIEDRNVKVECSWPDSCPRILGDENQLKQAFYNIMKNAVQSMPDGGTINIACSFDENRIEVRFSDMGKGISAKDIGRIFEPYYTTKQGGNGLGLMIVERIIREHGAQLTVESEPGKGTVFIIKFPLASRRIRMLPAPEAQEPELTGQ